jgi:hypothetical protein
MWFVDPEQKHETLTLHGVTVPVSGMIALVPPAVKLSVTGYGAVTRGAVGNLSRYTNIGKGGKLAADEVKENRTENYAVVVAIGDADTVTAGGDCGTGWWHEDRLLAMHCAKQTSLSFFLSFYIHTHPPTHSLTRCV